MPSTMPRMMLIALLLSPSLSWALGLGEIHLFSALNEPMTAEIDLLAASPDELTALRANLASREAFTRYGIDKPPFLSSLTFKVGKAKDGRDVLQVHSQDSIPEPFVTFLVEVNWARGRLMREYTVLLDPPVYAPNENANSAPPVAAPLAAVPVTATPRRQAVSPAPAPTLSSGSTMSGPAGIGAVPESIRVSRGDTLLKVARGLEPAVAPATVDQTMISLFRSNRDAFGGNINVLRQGAILRVPAADQIAALSQREANGEVRRQMDSWRAGESSAGTPSGHLRLVAPTTGGSTTGIGTPGAAPASGVAAAENQALKARVKELESQVADSKRLIEIQNNELYTLQHKPGPPAKAPVAAPPVAAQPPPVTQPAVSPAAPKLTTAPPLAAEPPAAAPEPASAPAAKKPAAAPPAADSGSWLDWVAANWWAPLAVLAVVLGGLGVAAMRRRRGQGDLNRAMDDTDVADVRESGARAGARRGADSFLVEETGTHAAPDFLAEPARISDTAELHSPEDTMSSESAVNLDQGDPLAEADFHMAYGLYDQAADLVRIALEREPDRRDLRLKLLEIYFVWGNKDAFLQTAKGLEATRDRAPPGEWDKIVIMGKQICPDEPMFAAMAGGGRGAGALVDLNLEGGENRVDIDLFGDPEGERSSLDHQLAKESDHTATTGESPGLHDRADHLDFTLDTPERGADESPTREMPPRDEPTVESELMNFGDANFLEPTTESPALHGSEVVDRLAAKLPNSADQTAEVSIDDLGLDLDHLDETGSASLPHLAITDHPSDAPTMVAGLDERSRAMMQQAEKSAQDRDLTELERELEASFVAELDSGSTQGLKTTILGPESAPTVLMPRELDQSPTSRFKASELKDLQDLDKPDVDSTSKLRSLSLDQAAGVSEHSIDLDLDRLATALGSGDTVQQPRADEEMFSHDVFDAGEDGKGLDLDVGEALNGAADAPTNKLKAQTNRLKPLDLGMTELDPVTMSEVGTKLDLARAYMDMGDPEGARSILEEVVQEGSASQKQEASRLIESLPG